MREVCSPEQFEKQRLCLIVSVMCGHNPITTGLFGDSLRLCSSPFTGLGREPGIEFSEVRGVNALEGNLQFRALLLDQAHLILGFWA
jgi:hypothetical protein